MIARARRAVGPYHCTMRRILQRLALVVATALLALLCLSSASHAVLIGALTAAVVAYDMLALAPRPRDEPPAREEPDHLSVDLTRRR